jgi:uncharacterized protein
MWQSLADYFWLCLAALVAGGINALAGGGTLLTFPALKVVLTPHYEALAGVFANGTSTVALVPASIGSSWGYRRELTDFRRLLIWLTPPSMIGGVTGAWLVVRFPRQFNGLIPWLILTAAVLFTLQPLVSRWLTRTQVASLGLMSDSARISPASLAALAALQLFISIYGGYFGAGIGILMLSGLAMMGLSNMHQMNGIKVVLAAIINGVAVLIFIWDGKVAWRYALAMMATSLVGGFLAAHFTRQIKGQYVRWFVSLVGFLLAAWYFLKP